MSTKRVKLLTVTESEAWAADGKDYLDFNYVTNTPLMTLDEMLFNPEYVRGNYIVPIHEFVECDFSGPKSTYVALDYSNSKFLADFIRKTREDLLKSLELKEREVVGWSNKYHCNRDFVRQAGFWLRLRYLFTGRFGNVAIDTK